MDLIFILIPFLFIKLTNSACHNQCNGHGYCSGNTCVCNSLWNATADCSMSAYMLVCMFPRLTHFILCKFIRDMSEGSSLGWQSTPS